VAVAVVFSIPHIPPEQGVLVAAAMLVKHTLAMVLPEQPILVLAVAAGP
jgi:hypothetical protein